MAIWYAGWLVDGGIELGGPQPTVSLSGGITGDVLFVVGDDDDLVPMTDVDAVDGALTQAGVPHEMLVVPGAGHAFPWPGTPAYDAAAADRAWAKTLEFLRG